MPATLLAVCQDAAGLAVKRVVTSAAVQNQVEGVFEGQHAKFLSTVDQEIPFDGGWKPDPNELFVLDNTELMANIYLQAVGNPTALSVLSAQNFADEGIKALGVTRGNGAQKEFVLQNFSARQVLDRHFALIYDGNTFNRLTEPSFSLGLAISAILGPNAIRFKNLTNVKMIFDVANIYQEASDAKIDQFALHGLIEISDVDSFKKAANQTMRKLVNAVMEKDTLNTYSVAQISAAAQSANFHLDVQNNKVVFPAGRDDIKKLLHFLDEGFFRGSLSGAAYITNSKRQV